jgi:hypothetical protein
MRPIVHGQWTEVRTLAVGELVPASPSTPVHTTNLSYVSRRTDSAQFTDQALLELHYRGVETAQQVGAVVDGAVWCQHFIDVHRPTAVRILDFAHAAEYLSTIGQTVGPTGPLLPAADLTRLRQMLKHTGPEPLLAELRTLVAAHPQLPTLGPPLAYLEARVAQMQYPQFVAAGWPIGSGMVESANKLVVEDRLKGAGMHWADGNINPLLALRNAVCNDRWDTVWRAIEREQRHQATVARHDRRRRRQTARPAPPCGRPHPSVAVLPSAPPALPSAPMTSTPAPTHPWRRPWSVREQRKQAGR